jgi:hypothetical protein
MQLGLDQHYTQAYVIQYHVPWRPKEGDASGLQVQNPSLGSTRLIGMMGFLS